MEEVIVIAGKIQSFIDFHSNTYSIEFIDTKEEMESNRQEMAQTIIRDFFVEKGIVAGDQAKNDIDLKTELVTLLLTETKLIYRKITKLLEIDNNTVHSTSNNLNKD